jgi:murein DD-endopeptidase MepM/ murein hydrolase activator NlpD
VRVDGARARIPLGHFADRRLGNSPGDVPNVVEIEGVKVGAEVNRTYMRGTRYSTSLVNLHRDARLTIGPAGAPMTPPGAHVFPLPDYAWNYGENWLQAVPYGWHLGVDLDAARGHPLLAIADSTVIAIRRFDAARQADAVHPPEDYWGNNLALLGDDGILYCYMHWERLAEGIVIGRRVRAGAVVGAVGRSGFESKPFATHLHLEMMVLKHPERFTFAYALEPEVLPTPNRYLQAAVEGHAINPYPYLVEWYLERLQSA